MHTNWLAAAPGFMAAMTWEGSSESAGAGGAAAGADAGLIEQEQQGFGFHAVKRDVEKRLAGKPGSEERGNLLPGLLDLCNVTTFDCGFLFLREYSGFFAV